MRNYFEKMKGTTKSPPRVAFSEVIWSWIGGFSGIGAVALLGNTLEVSRPDYLFLIGSFGSSAVLVYGAPDVPSAQPRSLVGGHVISATIGVAIYQVLPEPLFLSASLAVATAIAIMHLTKTIHPPGGASALIAVIGSSKIHDLGFSYVYSPVATGAGIMLLVALIINNIPRNRRHPQFWL